MAFNKNKWENKYADGLSIVRNEANSATKSTSGKSSAKSFDKDKWEEKYAEGLAIVRNKSKTTGQSNDTTKSTAKHGGTSGKFGTTSTGKTSSKEPVQIHALGASGGEKTTRVDNVVKAAWSGAASGFKKLAADFTSPSDNLSIGESSRAAQAGISQQEAEAEKIERQNNGWVGAVKRKLEKSADESSTKSQEYTAQAKEGLGTAGQWAVDAGIAALQFAGDAALNFVAPGTGLAAMAARSYGNASQTAKEMGLSAGEQQISGIKSAAIEVITEKLFGAGSKVAYGSGLVKNANLVNSLVNRLAKTDAGRTTLKAILAANEEGLEEVLSDILNPIADRALKLDDGKGDWSDLGDDYEADQMLEDYVIGAALGAIGGGTNVLSGQYKAENAQQREYEAYQKQLVNAGLVTSGAQQTAQEYQKIVNDSSKRGNRNLSDKETQNLETLIQGSYAQEDAQDISTRLAQLGTEADEQTVEAIRKTVNGNKLTRAEQKAFNANPYAQRVVNEMTDTHGLTSNEWYTDRGNAGEYILTNDGFNAEEAKNTFNNPLRANNSILARRNISDSVKNQIAQDIASQEKPTFLGMMENIKQGKSLAETAEKHNISDEVVERIYNLNPRADTEAFTAAFDTAVQMGQEGASEEALNKVPVLTGQQARIAYAIGRGKARTIQRTGNETVDDAVSKAQNGDISIGDVQPILADEANIKALERLTGKLENRSEQTVKEAIEKYVEGKHEVHLRDSSERSGGQNTRGQVREVESGAGQNKPGRDSKTESNDSKAQEKTRIKYGEYEQTATVYTRETDEVKQLEQVAAEKGYKVIPFAGDNLRIGKRNGKWDTARGVCDTESKIVWVRMDHPEFTAMQIMLHEMAHADIDSGVISIEDARAWLGSKFTQDEMDDLANVYSTAYGDVYTTDEAFVEIVCDAMGGMNIFEGTTLDRAKYRRLLKEIRNYNAESKSNSTRAPPKETMYSREVNGKQIVWIENNPLSLKDLTNYKKVAAYIAEHVGEAYTIIESGYKVYIGESLPNEYTQSVYTKQALKNAPPILKAKNKAIGNFGEMIEIATNRRWEKPKHSTNKDAKYGVYRYSTAFAFPVKQNGNVVNVKSFDAELVILNSSDGKKYLYDIVNIKENTADGVDLLKRDQMRQNAAARRSVSENNIAENNDGVKTSLERESDYDGSKGAIDLMAYAAEHADTKTPSKDEMRRRIEAERDGKASAVVTKKEQVITLDNDYKGDISPESGSLRFSLEENENIKAKSMAYFRKNRDDISHISQKQLESANEIVDEMVDYMKPYLDKANNKGKRYLPEEILGDTRFQNGSYGRTIENTTICFRTLAYIDFTNDIKERIGRPLTVEESFLASQMLYDIAKEPQCLYCYVSLDRKAYDEFLLKYIEQRDGIVEKINALSSEEKDAAFERVEKYEAFRDRVIEKHNAKEYKTDKERNTAIKREIEAYIKKGVKTDDMFKSFLSGRKPTQNMQERYNSWVKYAVRGDNLIGATDLTTEERRSKIKANGGVMAEQMADAEGYAQSASWAKKLEQYRAYNGEILSMSNDMVETLNSEYGLRFYSFSEYTPAFIVENMQQIRDASLKGFKGLAYTKKPDFARIFAPTGMNINISVFGRMDGGKVVPDTLQGADWAEVQELRKQYDNVGAVFVATTDEMVDWALEQDWIDVVIPFHIVRTGANVAEFYKWINHTSQQSDRVRKSDGKGGKKADITPPEHNNDYETYKKLIEKRKLVPRFKKWYDDPHFAGDKYMKLVNETRQPASKTPKLKPNFDKSTLEAAKKSFNTFVDEGGYYGDWYEEGVDYNEAVNTVVNDINRGVRANEVEYGRQDVDWTKAMENRGKNRQHGQKLSREADAEYMAAVESGDMETVQNMVDEAARNAGYKLLDGFYVDAGFKPVRLRKDLRDKAYKLGEYIRKNVIPFEGLRFNQVSNLLVNHDIIYEVYEIDGESISYENLYEAVGLEPEYTGVIDTYFWSGYAPEFFGTPRYAFGKRIGRIHPRGVSWNYRDQRPENGVSVLGLFEGGKYVPKNDGSFEFFNHGQKYIVWGLVSTDLGSDGEHLLNLASTVGTAQSLIKSSDPVTYDDNDNVIPLSKRFDSKNEDIRYSREQSKGKEYSGKNVDWAVENGIITEEERISFFHKVADINKLGHKYRQAKNGDYIVDLGGKLLFTNADWYSPSLNIVISFNDSFESSMLYAKEIVFNEAKSEANYNRARQAIETAYWQGYVEFSYSRNYQTNVGKNAGRERADSKANHGEDVTYSREPETISELKRQNKQLRERVEYWKGQTRPTKVRTLRKDDVHKLAMELKDIEPTSLKTSEIEIALHQMGRYLLNESEVRYSDLSEMADDLAWDIIDNMVDVGEADDLKVRKELKDRVRSSVLHDDGSPEFAAIRKQYRNKRYFLFDTNKREKSRRGVDSLYDELREVYGEGWFPSDIISPADQLEQLASVLSNTKGVYAESFEYQQRQYYAEEAAERMRNYIIDSVLDETIRQTAPTYADKANAKIAAQKAEIAAQKAEIAAQKAEIASIKKAEIASIKEALKKERERSNEVLKDFRASVKERDAKRKERQEKTKYKRRIERDINVLSDWLLKPDHKNALKHIPGELQETVRDFITSIDFASKQALKGKEPTLKDMKYITALERLYNYVSDQTLGEERYSQYLDLPETFTKELNSFIAQVNALARTNGGVYTVNSMTSAQLKDLSQLVKSIKKSITDMNKLYQNRTFQHAYEAGESDMKTLKGYVKSKAFTGNRATSKLDQEVMWRQSRPAHVFPRFGEGGRSIYQEFVDGQNKMAFLIKEVVDFTESLYTAEEAKKWAKEEHTFKVGDSTVTLTTRQLMSLYMLDQRKEGRQHIETGGFIVAPYNKGVLGLKKDMEVHKATRDELDKMYEELDDRAKEVAGKLQKFMAETGGKWGNYVSIRRYDVEMFKDKQYFPIKVYDTQLNTKEVKANDSMSLYQLLNMSFAKELSPKANQALVVSDILDVFANHMSQMAQYRSYALPVLDAMKWFNYKERNSAGEVTSDFKHEMRRAFGVDKNNNGFAEQFITHFIQAVSGTEGRADSSVNSFTLNRVNRAAVAYNLRVMIQQPPAIVRAGLYLNPVDLAASLKNYVGITTKENIDEMLKYSGVAVWKDLGFYDVNVSRGLQEMIKHDQSVVSKVNEAGMAGASLMDKVTWGAIWDACKKKVSRETDLDGEAYYKKVAEVFDEVIYNTQVVDSPLTKNELVRKKDFGTRLFTSFMSEPMTTASLVTSRLFDIQMKQATGAKLKASDYTELSKVCVVAAIAAVVNSALASIIDAWRDDDDYATFAQKWLNAWRVKLADELNPLTYFPYASQAWDYAKIVMDNFNMKWFGVDVYGNGTDIPITDAVNDMTKALEIFKSISEKGEESKYTAYAGFYKVAGLLSKLVGVPIANIMREVKSAHNNIWSDSKWVTYDGGSESNIKYAYKDGYLTEDEAIEALQEDAGLSADEAWIEVNKWKNSNDSGTTSDYVSVYDAIDNGGDIKGAVDEMLEHGKTEGSVKSAVTRKYKDAYINGDNAERERIRRALYKTGLYGSVNDVIEICNEWLK